MFALPVLGPRSSPGAMLMKLVMVLCACNLSTGGGGGQKQVTETCWPASRAHLASSKPVKDPISGEKK